MGELQAGRGAGWGAGPVVLAVGRRSGGEARGRTRLPAVGSEGLSVW